MVFGETNHSFIIFHDNHHCSAAKLACMSAHPHIHARAHTHTHAPEAN